MPHWSYSDLIYFWVLCWECPLETHSRILVDVHIFNTDILYSHKLCGLVDKYCLLPLGPWLKPSLGSYEKWAECLMDNSPLLKTTIHYLAWLAVPAQKRSGLYWSVINNFTYYSSSHLFHPHPTPLSTLLLSKVMFSRKVIKVIKWVSGFLHICVTTAYILTSLKGSWRTFASDLC